MLKDAANMLNINYSTAKTILRVFRKEKRIDKKNSKKTCDVAEDKSVDSDPKEKVINFHPNTGMYPIILDESKQLETYLKELENVHKYVSSNLQNIFNTQLTINYIFSKMSRIQDELNENSKKIVSNLMQRLDK